MNFYLLQRDGLYSIETQTYRNSVGIVGSSEEHGSVMWDVILRNELRCRGHSLSIIFRLEVCSQKASKLYQSILALNQSHV